MYKHPRVKDADFIDVMSHMMDLQSGNTNLMVIGDINCCPTKSTVIPHLCDLYSLHNLITEPTCFKGKPSILDVILVSNKMRYAGILNTTCSLSDFHNFVGTATKKFAPLLKPRKITYRSYKKFNESDFAYDIQTAPFHVMDIFDDPEDMAWYTSSLLGNIIDTHAPVKTRTLKKPGVPYMNSKLRKAQYRRNMARNKLKYGGKSTWENYRRIRNEVVALRKESISNYFSKQCVKKDKSFWRTVSPFMTDKGNRNCGNITLCENDTIVSDPQQVSEIFNGYFSQVAADIGFSESVSTADEAVELYKDHPSIKRIRESHIVANSPSFDFTHITSSEMCKLLKSINTRKAPGYDGFPGKLLRIAHNELCDPLAMLMNRCISSRCFPEVMKKAELSPIYKKCDNLHKGNYRPVSVLTCLSKLYESVLNDQLMGYFTDKFNDLVCAYRKRHSCQSLLLKFTEDWRQSLDNHDIVGIVLMDLSKAFDCLPHGLLVAKLKAYGLSSMSCDLIMNYLSNRKQRVKISHVRSSWSILSKGVPQGSILGPALFNIFVNDLFHFMERCKLYNYADDNTVKATSKHIDTLIRNLKIDLDNAIDWYESNGMEANANKFQFVLSSAKPLEAQKISFDNGIEILSQPTAKLLGITIDEKLKFSDHVSACCKKAARQLNALARISKYLDISSRKTVYNSFIASNFEYCPMVWHFCGTENCKKLEKIQERALRILYRDYNSSYADLLEKADVSTLLISRLRTMATEVFKIVNGLHPSSLNDMFYSKESHYDMRDCSILEQSRKNTTTYGLRSFIYQGAKLWNSLPLPIKTQPDVINFKYHIKSWPGPDQQSDPTSHLV